MKSVSKLLWIAGLAGLTATASAQSLWFPFEIPADRVAIPDNDANGEVIFGTVSGFDASYTISTNSFKVVLDLEGDPIAGTGDIYARLQAPTGQYAVLLNRTGLAVGTGLGYQDNGGKFTFYDGASDPAHKDSLGVAHDFTDVHFYQTDPVYGAPGDNPVDGIYKSDGRDLDPGSAPAQYTNATRDKTLAVFQGLNPNGEWTLFIADLNAGNSAKITGFGLDFTPIPEPQEYALAIGLGLMGFALYRRRTAKLA